MLLDEAIEELIALACISRCRENEGCWIKKDIKQKYRDMPEDTQKYKEKEKMFLKITKRRLLTFVNFVCFCGRGLSRHWTLEIVAFRSSCSNLVSWWHKDVTISLWFYGSNK